jgi:hypothetical protein
LTVLGALLLSLAAMAPAASATPAPPKTATPPPTVTAPGLPLWAVLVILGGTITLSAAISQAGGYTLGAQAGEDAIRQLVTDAGFTRFRRAAEAPFNLNYQARP